MTTIDLKCTGAAAAAHASGPLTAGAVGIEVNILFDEAWEGLTPTLICYSNKLAIPMVIAAGKSTVPHECMVKGHEIWLGVDGWDVDGTLRIPTIKAYCGTVRESVDNANLSEKRPEPTPGEIQQITAVAQKAHDYAYDVKVRADNGEFIGEKGDKGDKGDPGEDYDHSEEYAALNQQMKDYQKQVDDDREEIAASVEESKKFAERAEQAASKNGYFYFEVNEAGHLIETRTENVSEDLSFKIENGRLMVTYE